MTHEPSDTKAAILVYAYQHERAAEDQRTDRGLLPEYPATITLEPGDGQCYGDDDMRERCQSHETKGRRAVRAIIRPERTEYYGCSHHDPYHGW